MSSPPHRLRTTTLAALVVLSLVAVASGGALVGTVAATTASTAPGATSTQGAASTPTESATTTVDACRVIDEPGHYDLTTDLENGSQCIRIAAPNVTLDGNGHTITGTGAAADTAVLVRVQGGPFPHDVTVENLTVEGWERGVAFRLVEDATVRNVTARDATITMNHVRGATIVDTCIEDGAIDALASWDVDTRDATLYDSRVDYGYFVHGGTISDVGGDNATVVVRSSDDVAVTDSELAAVRLSDVENVTVARNGPDATGRFGVWITPDGGESVTIVDNHVTGNTGAGDGSVPRDGIRVEAVHDLTIAGNTIAGNDHGVHVVSLADRTTVVERCGEETTRTVEGRIEWRDNTFTDNTADVVDESGH